MIGQYVAPALLLVVLGLLHRMAQSLVATSNDTHHPVFGNAEGRRQFTGIEHTQSSTGACSHIEESPTPFHPRLDGLYQGFNLWHGLTDSLSHQHILVVDMLQQLQDRHLFEVVVVRGLFGDLLHLIV